MPPRLPFAFSVIAVIAFLAFAAFTAWCVFDRGVGNLFALRGEPWFVQAFLDAVFACTMFMLWLIPDARARKISPWPFVVLTTLGGSLGPMAYIAYCGFAGRRKMPS